MKPNQARQAAAKAIRLQFALHPKSITAENLNNDAACELLADVALTAAAEVGPTEVEALEEHQAMLRAHAEIEEATIERCAQWLEDHYPSARTIALEMRRALKE